MKIVEDYCDCCSKEAGSEDELTFIQISLGSCGGYTDKLVCFNCWRKYTNKMADISKEMFNARVDKGSIS